MKHLIRTSSHGNNVTVIDDLTSGVIVKSSSIPEGVAYLKKEQEGITWYEKRLKAEGFLPYSYENEEYSRLHIKKFAGYKALYKQPFVQNLNVIQDVIDHYVATWPKEDVVPIHGDLTLDNVIITEQGVRLFDWEHFSQNPHPWGFDALYFLLSALLLPLKQDEFPGRKECDLFIDILFQLIKHGLPNELAEYPLAYYRKFFRQEECWKDIVESSPHKLFPLKYEELYADIVDDQITRRIRHKRYEIWKKEQKGKA